MAFHWDILLSEFILWIRSERGHWKVNVVHEKIHFINFKYAERDCNFTFIFLVSTNKMFQMYTMTEI